MCPLTCLPFAASVFIPRVRCKPSSVGTRSVAWRSPVMFVTRHGTGPTSFLKSPRYPACAVAVGCLGAVTGLRCRILMRRSDAHEYRQANLVASAYDFIHQWQSGEDAFS